MRSSGTNLVCFSGNTGGGLLCELLSGVEEINLNSYMVKSIAHNVLKLNCSYREFDEPGWVQRVSGGWKWKWVGTHFHPSVIPPKYLINFDEVVVITNERRTSKLLRFLRGYYGTLKIINFDYYARPAPDQVLKEDSFYFTHRKNTILGVCLHMIGRYEPFPGCINVEFEDIVNGKFIVENNLNMDHFNEWKKVNPWLYTEVDPFLLEIFNEQMALRDERIANGAET